MTILPYIYLTYMFVALYMTSFFILLYFKNRKKLFYYPKSRKSYSLTIIIPAYNEEKSIESTVKKVLESDYKNLIEVIVVDDGSEDNTKKIVKKLASMYRRVRLLNKKNTGKADSINKAIEKARGELIGVMDADSYPRKEAIRKMIGFFNDRKVGVVTSAILVKNRKRFIEKLQAIEYAVIAWTRKLLEFVDSVYVTPGPLSIYRKDIVKKIRGFDTENLTEDIEITWRLAYYGYKRKMCIASKVYTVVPSKVRQWFKQRVRWNMGGFQTINKYKKTFLKRGMLGCFILPFFVISLFLGVVGLGIFAYVFISRFILVRFITEYRIVSDSSLLSLDDLAVTPTVLNVFGIFLFLTSLVYTLLAQGIMKEKAFKKGNLLYMPVYLVFYLMCYPFIIPIAIYKVLRKDISWGTK